MRVLEWPPKPPKGKKAELSPRISFPVLCWTAEPWGRADQHVHIPLEHPWECSLPSLLSAWGFPRADPALPILLLFPLPSVPNHEHLLGDGSEGLGMVIARI